MSLERVKSNVPPFDAGDEDALRKGIVELSGVVEAQAATITILQTKVAELEAKTVPIDPALLIPIEDIIAVIMVAIGEALKGHKVIAFPIE